MRATTLRLVRIVLLLGAGTAALTAQQAPPPPLVTSQEILDGLTPDGSRWLTFGGDYTNQRHSPLTQITPANVNRLVPQWTFQTGTLGNFETTSLLRDNVLYVTGPQNVAWALDARTGRQIWRYRRELPPNLTACCGLVNRGFGVLGDKLFMTTLDAHLLALDMKTGAIVWDAMLRGLQDRLRLDDCAAGRERQSHCRRGRRRVRHPRLHRRLRRANRQARVALLHDSRAWRAGQRDVGGRFVEDRRRGRLGDRGVRSGAESRSSTEPAIPGPDYHSESRKGDNLYSASLIALDADTGKLRWHYQFTPHDVHDWDATEVPILADLTIAGQPRKVVMFANRNGFYYTLDRTTGKVIVAKPFVTTTWAKEIGRDGRPIALPGHTPDEKGEITCPDITGGTNFWPPTYDPSTRTFFVNAREACMPRRSEDVRYGGPEVIDTLC